MIRHWLLVAGVMFLVGTVGLMFELVDFLSWAFLPGVSAMFVALLFIPLTRLDDRDTTVSEEITFWIFFCLIPFLAEWYSRWYRPFSSGLVE